MRPLDERFLHLHPRTALWWQQREQCRACAHLSLRESSPKCGGHQSTLWTCLAASDGRHHSAIEMRDPGSPCGPDATLFHPASPQQSP
jgi:rRNA maturation protein Nop10